MKASELDGGGRIARAAADHHEHRLGGRPGGRGGSRLPSPFPGQGDDDRVHPERLGLPNDQPEPGRRHGDRLGHVPLGMAGGEQQQRRGHHLPAAGGGQLGQGITDRGADHLEEPEDDRHRRHRRSHAGRQAVGLPGAERVGRAVAHHHQPAARRKGPADVGSRVGG